MELKPSAVTTYLTRLVITVRLSGETRNPHLNREVGGGVVHTAGPVLPTAIAKSDTMINRNSAANGSKSATQFITLDALSFS